MPVYTKPQVLDQIEAATVKLLDAAGELSQFPWTEESSAVIDEVLSLASQVTELRKLNAVQSALPKYKLRFVAHGRSV